MPEAETTTKPAVPEWVTETPGDNEYNLIVSAWDAECIQGNRPHPV